MYFAQKIRLYMLPAQSVPRNNTASCGSSTCPWSCFRRPPWHTHHLQLSPVPCQVCWSPLVPIFPPRPGQLLPFPPYTHFSPLLLLTVTLISHFLPIAHAHIKTSMALTAVSQEERARQFFVHYIFYSYSFLCLCSVCPRQYSLRY